MSELSRRKVDFNGSTWTATNDEIIDRIRCWGTEIPLPSKTLEAVRARMNNWGHAHFRKHELAGIIYGKSCPADVGKVHMNGVRDQLHKLVKVGLAAPESTLLCVVLDWDYFQRPAGKGNILTDLCHEPSHLDPVDLRLSTWHSKASAWHDRSVRGTINHAGNQSDQGEPELEGIEGIEAKNIELLRVERACAPACSEAVPASSPRQENFTSGERSSPSKDLGRPKAVYDPPEPSDGAKRSREDIDDDEPNSSAPKRRYVSLFQRDPD